MWGSNLRVILALPRFISHTKRVGWDHPYFLIFDPFFVRVEKIRREWIFNVLWYVSMWFPMLPELIQVIGGYIKTFPQGCSGERGFDDLDACQRGHVEKGVFGQSSNFFQKSKYEFPASNFNPSQYRICILDL